MTTAATTEIISHLDRIARLLGLSPREHFLRGLIP
jgi:hypothetical protein